MIAFLSRLTRSNQAYYKPVMNQPPFQDHNHNSAYQILNQTKRQPIVVVVTVKKDGVGLQKLFSQLKQQTTPPDCFVVTVAADSDADLTWQTAKKLASRKFKILSQRQANLTRSAGRNLGVKLALKYFDQPILVFTDAGCDPTSSWLAELTQPFFTQKNVELASGLTLVKPVSALWSAQGAFVLPSKSSIPDNPNPATRNMAIIADTFIKAGGFDDRLNYAEDYEFARRLKKMGVYCHFLPKAKVYWLAHNNLISYWQMIYQLTLGDWQAGTWRLGQLTMLGRYLLFLALLILAIKLSLSITFVLTLYLIYLSLKVLRFKLDSLKAYTYVPLLQLLTDTAVISGTLVGIVMTRINNASSR